VIVWVPPAGRVLGLPSEQVTPFLAVVVILFLQWSITLIRPVLERFLVYAGDQTEVQYIQELETRLITGADCQQLLESILAATCDYLRVKTAFVASLSEQGPRLERAIGLHGEVSAELEGAPEFATTGLNGELPQPAMVGPGGQVFTWHDFWLIPLHSHPQEMQEANSEPRLVGLLGVAVPDEGTFDEDKWHVLMALATRAAEVLEDRRLQAEVFRMLRGLLPEISAIQALRGVARYQGVAALTAPREELPEGSDLAQAIKDALTHYWGGPKLTSSHLMRLAVVRQALDDNDGNPQKAMRYVLQRAIESLRPEGQRSMTTTEWILYNILEMRFIQGRKVREVARRLAMSESDFYRKQRVAITEAARALAEMDSAVQ
jgi:hypothetical protein